MLRFVLGLSLFAIFGSPSGEVAAPDSGGVRVDLRDGRLSVTTTTSTAQHNEARRPILYGDTFLLSATAGAVEVDRGGHTSRLPVFFETARSSSGKRTTGFVCRDGKCVCDADWSAGSTSPRDKRAVRSHLRAAKARASRRHVGEAKTRTTPDADGMTIVYRQSTTKANVEAVVVTKVCNEKTSHFAGARVALPGDRIAIVLSPVKTPRLEVTQALETAGREDVIIVIGMSPTAQEPSSSAVHYDLQTFSADEVASRNAKRGRASHRNEGALMLPRPKGRPVKARGSAPVDLGTLILTSPAFD